MRSFTPPRTHFCRRKQVHTEISAALADLRASAEVGLHLGAGSSRIGGLINCDLFNEDADQKVDATLLDDFNAESVDLIEHHHMIEHLSFEDFDRAMAEWYRVLKSSGYLVFTCPDIARVCRRYIKLRIVGLVYDRSEQIDYTIKMIVGSQEHESMFHKNHFDPTRVKRMFPKYGFEPVYITAYPRRPTPSMLVVARKV